MPTLESPRSFRFSPGRFVGTPGALEALKPHEVTEVLRRHLSGDWGEIPPEDVNENKYALEHGLRLMSAYTVNGTKVWVITEADRSVTTILLPEEY